MALALPAPSKNRLSGLSGGPVPGAVSAASPAVLPPVVRAAHPLLAELKARSLHSGSVLIEQFVEGLDAALQAHLAECRNAAETRELIDLGHALSYSGSALTRGFIAALGRGFDPLSQPASREPVAAEAIEEHLVLRELAERAEALAGEGGRQLVARLRQAAQRDALPLLAEALAPTTLPRCFAEGFRAAGLTAPERLLAYRLVESNGLLQWPALVQAALELLDRLGWEGPRALARGQDEDAGVSAATWKTLRDAEALALPPQELRFVATLLRALEPPSVPTGAALVARLAGQWFDGLCADSTLPPALASDLEALRLVLLKAAVCDPALLTQPVHPVRSSVEDWMRRAAFTGLLGVALGGLRQELLDLAARIGIHGQFAVDSLAMMTPLDADFAARCQRRQQQDRDARRANLVQRVRELAHREIESRTLEIALPPSVRAALTRGFQPLLCALTLRHGAAASATREARDLLGRFVDSFTRPDDSRVREDVLRALHRQAEAAGLAGPQLDSVSAELRAAYVELAATAQAATVIDPMLASSTSAPPAVGENLLLSSGQWFRVRDGRRGEDRWLMLSSVHLAQDRLVFSGSDGAAALALRASIFMEQLRAGIAEPLNPTAAAADALRALRRESSASPAEPPAPSLRFRSLG
jgi:hypothetical protein